MNKVCKNTVKQIIQKIINKQKNKMSKQKLISYNIAGKNCVS